MKDSHSAGDLDPALCTAAAIEGWLRAELAATLALPPEQIDSRRPFRDYGLESAAATALVARLGKRLGRALPPTLTWEQPNLAALVASLTRDSAAAGTADPRAATASANEPIAILGMSCRFPGGASSKEAFWRLLREGRDAISEVPKDRWDIARLYDPDRAVPGKMSTRWGGFLDGIDGFDAPFFQISRREAAHMDPQQRLVLELSWEALEDAGQDPEALLGSRTGVFIGAMWSPAGIHGDPSAIAQHTATGQDTSILAARVSYFLGLQGPSLTVNTACSSSLVAIHLACQSLRSGESQLAFAGGVSLLLSPESSIAMSKFGAMSPDGRCKAFDARANGYVRGEGGGLVVLKPLARALADGDAVQGVIVASAVNNDGQSNGLTAPNPQAQEAVLRAAYARAGLPPASVQYVETHGPGTLLGDPIEAGALGAVLGADRPADRPLRIGSVKTNIGHTEAAAGIAGLLKTVLAMKHGQLPASLHFQVPNPAIPFQSLRIQVQQRLEPWPASSGPRIAGVSAFGFGGTNCHVVLKSAPEGTTRILPFAASDPRELRKELLAALSIAAGQKSVSELDGLCRDAAARGSGGPFRIAVLAQSPADLCQQLVQELGDVDSCPRAPSRPRLVFVCPGQGGQWLGMGRALLASEPVFRARMKECDEAIRAITGWSILDELLAEEGASRLGEVGVVQPLLFALQVALGALLGARGIEPDVLIGHSMGEIAAAHLAGILSLEDAARIICQRSRLCQRRAGGGGMLVVGLSAAEALAALQAFAGTLTVGAYNSPRSTVLSGDRAAIAAASELLGSRGIPVFAVNVTYASHSPHMDALREELLAALHGICPRRARVRMLSTVQTSDLAGPECGPSYWVRNLRQPVSFLQAAEKILAEGPAIFVELCPHPTLTRALDEIIAHHGAAATSLAVLRRDEEEHTAFLQTLGTLYERGANVLWQKEPGQPCLLPLSAHSPEALRDRVRGYQTYLEAHADPVPEDVCFTAGVYRPHHPHRLALLGRSREELLLRLRAALTAPMRTPRREPSRLVFLFPGQGSQWIGMGERLLREAPAFRTAIRACEQAMRPYVSWSLEELLRGEGSGAQLDTVDCIQPALFAMQLGLAALWRSLGITPHAVAGHSMGEVAAACVAGRLHLADAARIICLRSQLVRRTSGSGGMALVERSVAQAKEAIRGYEDRLCVGVENGPRSTVLTGEGTALAEVLSRLATQGVFCRTIKVDYASHSPQMDALLPELVRTLSGIGVARGQIPFYSTVSGGKNEEPLTEEYWARNLREPVLFSSAITALLADGFDTFLEISPHPILLPSVEEGLSGRREAITLLSSLRQKEGGRERLLESLGRLYELGHPVHFGALHPDGGRRVPLPGYPFQHERYPIAAPPAVRSGSMERRGLLGPPLRLSTQPGTRVWQAVLSLEELPYLKDHRVQDAVVLPGAAYVQLALAAAQQLTGAEPCTLESIAFHHPLTWPGDRPQTVQLVVTEDGAQGLSFQITSTQEPDSAEPWTRNASGRIRTHDMQPVHEEESVHALRARCQTELQGASLYEQLSGRGLHYGPGFRGAQRIQLGQNEALGELRLPEGLSADPLGSQAILLDAGFQVLVALLASREPELGTVVPTGAASVQHLRAPGRSALCRASLRPGGADGAELQGDVRLLDEAGRVLVDVQGLSLRRLEPANAQTGDGLFFSIEWIPAAPQAPAPGPAGRWLLLSEEGSSIEPLQAALASRGATATWIRASSLDLRAPEAFGALLNGEPLAGVVHLLGCDPGPAGELTTDRILDAQLRGCGAALHLLQALSRTGARDVPRLFFVTRGTQRVGSAQDVVSPAYASLWGLARTLAGEHPELRCRRIDLAPTPTSSEIEDLASTLLHDEPEEEMAFRGSERLVARYTRRPPAEPRRTASPIRPDGTYLLSGGLGGLGLEAARWLAERGARSLVLLSRGGPTTDSQREALAALERMGVRVEQVQADVCERSQMERVITQISESLPPLRGVLHAAGVLDDGLLVQQSMSRIDKVLAPKILGAWNLHELTRGLALDLFVLYSSAASLLGLPGQGGYAAGNAFLDALAHHRRAAGLPALCINWGAFAEAGMAVAQANRGSRLSARGMRSLTLAEGSALLGRLLESDEVQLGVLPLDLRQWAEFYPGVRTSSLWSALIGKDAEVSRPRNEGGTQKDALQGMPAQARRERLEQSLKESLGTVLSTEPARIDRSGSFKSLGVDSLLGLELRNRVETALGISLSATVIWNYPTIASLAEHLSDRLGGGGVAHAEPAAARPDQAPSELDRLSDEELERLGQELLG